MWYIILSLIAAIYILINLILPGTLGGVIEAYVIRPILWISLAILVFLIAKNEGLNIWQFKRIRKWQIGKSPIHAAILVAVFQIALLLIFGIFQGFGKNPYTSFTPQSIIISITFVGSMLFGIELSRAYLIKKGTSTRKDITLILALTALLFMLIRIPTAKFLMADFGDPAALVRLLGENVIPLLTMSLFASYLAYLGGATASMSYMGILLAFEWFSPFLPDLDWTLAAFVGTLAPAIGFLIIQNSFQLTYAKHGRRKIRKKIKDPALAWTGLAVISLLLVFFSFGYLGVQPTVIYTGSMRPALDVGDVVIISEVPIDEIQEGDIIQYRTENVPFVHRVYEIYGEGDTKVFITKGDANNAPDADPISREQIMGKAVFNIPKIGWIPIAIKSLIKQIGFTI